MKLYYSPGACSLAPHIILRESGADFTLEKVNLATKKTESGGDYYAVTPKGYVPALSLNDGEVITEGTVIQQYLADSAPASGLAPERGSKERRDLESLLAFISTELHKGHAPLFSSDVPDNAKPIFRDRIGKRYDLVEKMLSDGRDYLTGDSFSIADAYLFTVLSWAPFVGVQLENWPKLSAYAQRVRGRPTVQAALKAEGLVQ